MTVKTLSISLLVLVSFSSCQQFKNITAHDTSSYKAKPKQKNIKEVLFLEDISVTPGQVVTTKHATTGPAAPRSYTMNNASKGLNYPAADMERGGWSRLKYAMILNESPENLTNTTLLKLIDEWWGTRYALGGTTKDGIDCSAFTQVVMSNAYGISLPRTAAEQYKASEQIEEGQLQEGDLVFFNTGRSISHVGMYLTNNKFVHASTSQGVMVSDLGESYWKNKYKGAGRIKSY